MALSFSHASGDTRYCTIAGHVRVYAGSVPPETCACGEVRYVKHTCICGDVHERPVLRDPITREWDTDEEDEAWKHL